MTKPSDYCTRCKKQPVEVIDDWVSQYCDACNDRLAEKYREQQEYLYYHTDIFKGQKDG
jgi:hypothetical protein